MTIPGCPICGSTDWLRFETETVTTRFALSHGEWVGAMEYAAEVIEESFSCGSCRSELDDSGTNYKIKAALSALPYGFNR